MDLYQHIRESRLFSISMTVFTSICLWEALQWIYTLSQGDLTAEKVALATAVLSALVALVKFSYTFAMDRSNNIPPLPQNNKNPDT